MKNKVEVFSKFKEFKALIENHTEKSRPFDQIMAENSHQMNSKSYAKNQGLRGSYLLHIIQNRMGLQKGRIEPSWKPIRAMLHDQDLPMHLWAEAARTTVYVQNRTPHRVLENKTPEEVFSGVSF